MSRPSDQVDFLYDADADQVQGFYFGKPVSAAEASIDILKGFSKTATAGETGATKSRIVKQAS